MAQPSLSVSWDAYQNSICRGLSTLQQRGEFVDMTLAADGHMVRVHRMVMSLISPYIKQLIASADCQHPVIFLNQVSYKTLSSILDYAYTGVVQVPNEELNAFIVAGKALHIRGIVDMNIDHTLPMLNARSVVQIQNSVSNSSTAAKENREKTESSNSPKKESSAPEISRVFVNESSLDDDMDASNYDDVLDQDYSKTKYSKTAKAKESTNKKDQPPSMQYSVSNQGNLQMVLNRYLYYLVYTGRNSGHRRWQCIDNHSKRTKCQAAVVTKNNVIVQRISAHNHSFHDAKILRKVQNGTVFSGIQQAEDMGKMMVEERGRSGAGSQDDSEDRKSVV